MTNTAKESRTAPRARSDRPSNGDALPLDSYLDAIARRQGQDPEKECGCPEWVLRCVHLDGAPRVALVDESAIPPHCGSLSGLHYSLHSAPEGRTLQYEPCCVLCPQLTITGCISCEAASDDIAQAEFDRLAEQLRVGSDV